MRSFLETFRFVNALAPVADAFSGTVYPAGVNMKGIARGCFIVQKGVGVLGTSTITLLASSDNNHAASQAIEFTYRQIGADNKTIGAVTKATTAGFVTTAGSGDMYAIEFDAKALAASGYKYVQLKAVESVNDPVLLSVLFIGTDQRFADDTSDIVS
jgi:hypothetical protein